VPKRDALQSAVEATGVSLAAAEDAVASASTEQAAANAAHNARVQAAAEAQKVADEARAHLGGASKADFDAPTPATQKAVLAAQSASGLAESRLGVAQNYVREAKATLDVATKALGEAKEARGEAQQKQAELVRAAVAFGPSERREKAVLRALIERADGRREVVRGLGGIARDSGYARSKAAEAIQSLVRRGYIEILSHGGLDDFGGKVANRYRVVMPSKWPRCPSRPKTRRAAGGSGPPPDSEITA
jgi:uncharacterized membrane protein